MISCFCTFLPAYSIPNLAYIAYSVNLVRFLKRTQKNKMGTSVIDTSKMLADVVLIVVLFLAFSETIDAKFSLIDSRMMNWINGL